MDHLKAVEENLAERYLLQEMSAAETEEFEQHFFGHTFVQISTIQRSAIPTFPL